MTSERRNVWKVIESQDLYDNIMNMNELERLTRLEAQASTADENEFDFLTDLEDITKPTTSTVIQSEDDAFNQLNSLLKSSHKMEKNELEKIFSNRADGLKYDFSVLEDDFREQLDSLTKSFINVDKDELENYSLNHEAITKYHQQFRNQPVLQYLKPSDEKPEQLDSLTESFIKLDKDGLEDYSATYEAYIQYRQQFRQYVRDNMETLEDKAELFLTMIFAVPLISAYAIYLLIYLED